MKAARLSGRREDRKPTVCQSVVFKSALVWASRSQAALQKWDPMVADLGLAPHWSPLDEAGADALRLDRSPLVKRGHGGGLR